MDNKTKAGIFIGILAAMIIFLLVFTGVNENENGEPPYTEDYLPEENGEVEPPTPTEPPTRPQYIEIRGQTFPTTDTELDLRFMGLTDNDIAPIRHMYYLEWLVLGGNEITDISPFSNLTNLTVLGLWNNNITDISPLAALTNLETLHLDSNNITDVSALAGLVNLEWLTMQDNNIEDLSPLSGLGVQQLNIALNPVSDIEPLSYITALEGLWAFDTQITDIAPIAALANLEILSLNRTQIADFDLLAGHTRLEQLQLDGTGITDLAPLSGMTNLQILWLDYNGITDISPLAGLADMRVLWLMDNRITDISPLAGMESLEFLALSNNYISDISPIVGLDDLVYLFVSGNEITDISTLAGMSLIALLIDNNDISDISALAGMDSLFWVNAEDTAVIDWSPLSHVLLVGGRVFEYGDIMYDFGLDWFIREREIGFVSPGDASLFFLEEIESWNPALVQSGSPIFEIVEGPYGNAVHVSGRNQGFYALDLMLGDSVIFDPEENTYEITVTGRNPNSFPITFVVGAMDSPWNWLFTIEADAYETFTLTETISPEILHAVPGGIEQFTGRGFRFNTGCTNDYIIYSIVVVRR